MSGRRVQVDFLHLDAAGKNDYKVLPINFPQVWFISFLATTYPKYGRCPRAEKCVTGSGRLPPLGRRGQERIGHLGASCCLLLITVLSLSIM